MEVFKAAFSEASNSCDRIAIKADGKSYSYGQLTSSALRISKLFLKDDTTNGGQETKKYEGFGSLKGARIGIVAKPSAEFVAGVLGTWFSGGVAVPLALSYPEAELLHVMNDSDISLLLSTEDHSETMKTIAAKSGARFHLIPPVVNSTSETVACNQFQDDSFEAEGKFLDDPALIVYTSGTTGKPKGVVHTHNSINSQVYIRPPYVAHVMFQIYPTCNRMVCMYLNYDVPYKLEACICCRLECSLKLGSTHLLIIFSTASHYIMFMGFSTLYLLLFTHGLW
jgi:malonyl-CoA/methylmalonyl-CoA synthetase